MIETPSPPPLGHRLLGACANMPAGDRKRLARATWLLAAWAVAYVAAGLSLSRGLVPSGAAAYVAAAVPIALSIAGVLTWVHFLRHADELQRKIQLEAMALGFGAGFVVSYGLGVLVRAGLPPVDATTPFTAMVLCYVLGILVSGRRYA